MMNNLIKKCTDRLRVKTKFWLIDNENVEVKVSRYPFDKNKMPIMCKFNNDENFESREAYESGNRSIIFNHDGGWFKAKGIGIPKGISKPIYKGGKIYTYQLYEDLEMCHHSALWGFMERSDLESELFGAEKTNELGINIEPYGFAAHKEVFCISMKDRRELFQYLKSVKERELLDRFLTSTQKTVAYSFYAKIPSDLRVQELLYVFMFPRVKDMLDERDCIDYVKWLGSSCGYRLRQLHDADLTHGTWIGDRKADLGLKDVHSNSYTGNHTISGEKTWLLDYDLTKTSQDGSLRDLEKWCLIHMENPLFYAGSYLGNEALRMGIAKKNVFREALSKKFEDGVNEGYAGEVNYIEKQLRRDMLDKITEVKRALWSYYKLPEDLIGDIYYIDALVSKRPMKDVDVNKIVNSIQI